MKYARWIVLPMVFAATAGCVPLFYAYPSVSYVPGLKVGPDHNEIAAFRVEITEESGDPGHYRFRQLPITPHGLVWGQALTSLDDGYYWNCITHTYAWEKSHTMRVRLYRPGYDLLEIHSWQGEQAPQWKTIAKGRGQEKVIDSLIAPVEGMGANGNETSPFPHLDPGSASVEHRNALLFVAGEYERLAQQMETLDEGSPRACKRCRAKAKALHELAER